MILFLKLLLNAVALDEKVEIRGFGTFSKKYIRPRKFINPKTKKVSYLGETATMHFKPSKFLIKKMIIVAIDEINFNKASNIIDKS